jgi:uncharacterized protein with ParB-like and HNH nuclease domain
MQEIQGKTRTVRELLSGAKYGIDYYQREYKWQTKQMVELVSDLTGAFWRTINPSNEATLPITATTSLAPLLSASARTSKISERLIVDGQQRLTSLTAAALPAQPAKRPRRCGTR